MSYRGQDSIDRDHLLDKCCYLATLAKSFLAEIWGHKIKKRKNFLPGT